MADEKKEKKEGKGKEEEKREEKKELLEQWKEIKAKKQSLAEKRKNGEISLTDWRELVEVHKQETDEWKKRMAEYKKRQEEEKDDCPICFESIGQKSKTVRIFTCEHAFHNKCMQGWLVQNIPDQWNAQWTPKTCPSCRCSVFRPDLPKQDALASISPKIKTFVLNQAMADQAPQVHPDANDNLRICPSLQQLVQLGYFNQPGLDPHVHNNPVECYNILMSKHDAISSRMGNLFWIERSVMYCAEDAKGVWDLPGKHFVNQPRMTVDWSSESPLPPLTITFEGRSLRLCRYHSDQSKWLPTDNVRSFDLYQRRGQPVSEEELRAAIARYADDKHNQELKNAKTFYYNIVRRWELHIKCLSIPEEYDRQMSIHVKQELSNVYGHISHKWEGQGPISLASMHLDRDVLRKRWQYLHAGATVDIDDQKICYADVLLTEPITIDGCLTFLGDALRRGEAKKAQAMRNRKALGTWSIPNQQRAQRDKEKRKEREEKEEKGQPGGGEKKEKEENDVPAVPPEMEGSSSSVASSSAAAAAIPSMVQSAMLPPDVVMATLVHEVGDEEQEEGKNRQKGKRKVVEGEDREEGGVQKK